MGTKRNVICLAIPSLSVGGMERVMSEIACDFAARPNCDIHLLMFGRSPELFYDIPPVVHIHKPSFQYSPAHRTWFTIKTILYIRKEIKSIKPDCVLSFGDLWNSLVLLSCLFTGAKIFVSDRCQPDYPFSTKYIKLRNLLYPKAKGVIAQTRKAKEIYQKMYRNENIVVIGNPIRNVNINHNVPKEKIILSVGRLINTKHYDRLIKSFSEIDIPNWKLCIVGGDAIKLHNSEKYKQLIKELHLEDRVLLAGSQKNVDDYLNRASIFAFPSSSEGFPNVVGEAMAAGLPVVSYDCVAGPSEMIEDGKNGFLVPVFDDEAMKQKLIYLMQHEDERIRMGEYARQSIRKFDKDIICQKFYDFITATK